MDIQLIPTGKGAKFTFPALPEKLKGGFSAKYQSFDIISKGTIKIPKGTNPSTYSWEGEFFGKAKKKEPMVKQNAWREPSECVRVLTEWMKNGTTLNLIITDTWINEDVTISSFTATPYGAYGNVNYNIELSVKSALQIFTTNEMNISTFTKKTTPRNTAPAQKKYTVVKGDNLWAIARKFYGGTGSNWEKIYNANKDIIEKTANKYRKGKGSDHGHWIYPGTEFVIP